MKTKQLLGVGWALALGIFGTVRASAAVAVGFAETFDLNVGNWAGGASPTHVASGGPLGVGDGFLRISSVGGNLGTRNAGTWSGDYLSAGVTGLTLDFNLLSGDPVELRLMIFGPSGAAFTSSAAFQLSAGSGWVQHTFGLDADALTSVGSPSATLSQTLGNVSQILLRHDAGEPSSQASASPVTATLGIDNVTAIPEPLGAALVSAGVLAAAAFVRGGFRRGSSDSAS